MSIKSRDCKFCGRQGSLGTCSGCDGPICDDCADSHFEDHEVWMKLPEKLLNALKRRGFVVVHELGSLRVVPSDRLIPGNRAAIDRAEAALMRLLGQREENP